MKTKKEIAPEASGASSLIFPHSFLLKPITKTKKTYVRKN